MASTIDRLSAFPNDALIHILSFLPTKLSVSTSILARRWRFLWSHVPNLDFNRRDHHSEASFASIINNVMSLHKAQSINTFRLYHTDYCGNDELQTWITAAVARNVKYLYLINSFGFHHNHQLVLPPSIFTCKNLVSLRLDRCGSIPASGSVFLPALKKLHLYRVTCESDESIPHLLSGCPVLEYLNVYETWLDRDALRCYISSPTIISLNLTFGYRIVYGFSFGCKYRVEIDKTPALRYLWIRDYFSNDFSARSLASLVEADVIFTYVAYDSVVEFVGRLYNVKCLKLSSRSMQVPGSAFSALTQFNRT